MAKYGNDPFKILDKFTYSCKETFHSCKIGVGEVEYDCCGKYFNPGFYIVKNKCYSTIGKLEARKRILLKI